ncbi:hypothetical protein MRB53_020958 [Persea americana]|uniref:Uncharacterized protein n=1 Tax=Persea americana TaxID=3435 RepID=A0ACC2L398_PERAE|nr:hypothetical protein MRB53_020958 [Persea americana]
MWNDNGILSSLVHWKFSDNSGWNTCIFSGICSISGCGGTTRTIGVKSLRKATVLIWSDDNLFFKGIA